MKKDEKIFYKYTAINPDYTFEMLEKKYFYFSKPNQLNDEEDCLSPFDFEAPNRKILDFIKRMRKRIRQQGGDPSLFPYDTVQKMKDAIQNHGFDEILAKGYEKVLELFHVYCLTISRLNKTLWEKNDYNDNYSGVCIGIKAFKKPESSIWNIKVNESERKKVCFGLGDDEEASFPLAEVKYDNDRKHRYNFFDLEFDKNFNLIIEKCQKNFENFKHNILHKTEKWQSEEEYRGFYTADSFYDEGKIGYPDENIVSVSFGINIKPEYRDLIINIFKEKYSNFHEIKFFVTGPDENKNPKEQEFWVS